MSSPRKCLCHETKISDYDFDFFFKMVKTVVTNWLQIHLYCFTFQLFFFLFRVFGFCLFIPLHSFIHSFIFGFYFSMIFFLLLHHWCRLGLGLWIYCLSIFCFLVVNLSNVKKMRLEEIWWVLFLLKKGSNWSRGLRWVFV